MVEYNTSDKTLSEILKATSDVTRRQMLTTLIQEGPTRVTDLASYFSMSLNAVSKHIKVLENAGLVKRHKHGRIHLIEAQLEAMNAIDLWLKQLRSIWEIRLEKLDTLLSENPQEENHE